MITGSLLPLLCVVLLLFLSGNTNLFLSPSTQIHRQSVCDRFCRTSQFRALLCRPLLTCMAEICRTGGGSQRPYLTACPQGDSLKTSIQLDFGDGIKITYSNLSRTDDGIRHIYRATGIYRVTASAENEQGSDSSMLFLHITSKAPPSLVPAAASIADPPG